MLKKALITGVTGQDGSYLAELLLLEGYEVYGLARRTSLPHTSRLASILNHPHFMLHFGDVTDAGFMMRMIRNIEPHEVYNLAAQSFVGTSFEEPSHTMAVNFGGCLNCLEAIRMMPKDVRPRFYQASTSEMFGSSYSLQQDYDQFTVIEHFDYKETPPDHILCRNYCGDLAEQLESLYDFRELNPTYEHKKPFQDEATPFRPNSPYAVAKLAAHNLVKIYREAYGMYACSGILFNHESPRRGEEFVTRKITKYIGNLCAKGFKEVGHLKLGNIKAYRDWGHAKDYVRGQVSILQQDTPSDYVLATGETHSVEEFLQVAFELVHCDYKEYVDSETASEMRPSEVPYLCGDASKAAESLKWSPSISFKELVSEMVYSDIELARHLNGRKPSKSGVAEVHCAT